MTTAEFGALLHLRAQPGRRDELVTLLRNYANTLDGEPGTVLFTAAVDPGDADAVWLWEEFADSDALKDHFQHDFFRALQLELGDLLAEPATARPLSPVVRRVNPGVAAELIRRHGHRLRAAGTRRGPVRAVRRSLHSQGTSARIGAGTRIR